MPKQDQESNLDDLKTMIQGFCEARDWDQFHSPKELAIGLITEASELLEVFRFQSEEQIKEILADPEKRISVEDEIADTFFFILRFSQMYKIDLSSSLERKMEKNARRYPVEKAKGSNAKR